MRRWGVDVASGALCGRRCSAIGGSRGSELSKLEQTRASAIASRGRGSCEREGEDTCQAEHRS